MNSSNEILINDQVVPDFNHDFDPDNNHTVYHTFNEDYSDFVQNHINITDQYIDESTIQSGDNTVTVINNRITDYWLTKPYLGRFYHDLDENNDNMNMIADLFINGFGDQSDDYPVFYDLDYEDTDPGTDDEQDYETDPNDYSDEDLDNVFMNLRT
jgi:hypothetical protein